MKVFWLVNVVLPEAGKKLNIKYSVFGGWIIGALNAIREKAEITVGAVSDVNEILENRENGVNYVVFPNKNRAEMSEMFGEYLTSHEYDIVHIYGTEMLCSAAMIDVADKNKTVIHIQGLASVYADNFDIGIPKKYVCDSPIKAFLTRKHLIEEPVSYAKKRMEEKGRREVEILKKAKNVLGRTDWDRENALKINPKLNYYHVCETLRDSFYTEKHWSVENCERHSIFISQANYSVKGTHLFLQALRIIKEKYPDVKVYIGGEKGCIQKHSGLYEIRDRYFNGFFGYINTLCRDYNLYENLVMTGLLNEKEMAERYLKSNVFVLPSLIENSPNSLGEAMLLGLPCVSSDVGGVSSMAENEKEALLYSVEDINALANNVIRIFEDDSLAKKLSENAMKKAKITHSRELNSSALMDVYNTIFKANQ